MSPLRRHRRFLPLLLALLLTGAVFCPAAAAAAAETVPLTPAERQWLHNHPVITLAPDPDFKPIEYFDEKGVYQGAAADIIRILEKKLGITITIVRLTNWDEAMDRFQQRRVDLLGAMVRTPNRERFALFTDTLVAVPGGIFARSGSPAVASLSELKGRKVAVVSNYAAHHILRDKHPELTLVVVPDVSTGLAKASLGMVDYYVENMANATYYSQEAGITNLYLAGKTDFDYRWGIGIRKDWPELQAILNKGLAAISDAERQAALQRWIFIEGQRWRPSRIFIIGAVAAALALLLLLAVYWNASLRRLVRSRTASLERELAERQKAEAALRTLAAELEKRVRDRTGELEREIGERIKSEKAALASEQRFRELFQNVADPVYIADLSGKIIAANDQACTELGYSREELLRTHVTNLDTGEIGPDRVAAFFRDHPDAQTFTFESCHRRKDGSTFPVELKARVIDFEGSRALLGVARNLSERKQAEEHRLRLEQQLLHAQKLESLGVLAGGIAHDFNNILTAIIGNADLAIMRLNPESPALDNLQRIEKAACRAADLAKQMLAYSGKGKFVVEVIDLNRLVEEMGHMLEVSISKKAVLRYNLTRPLPAVRADATQLRQIIMNLVINASEAIGDRSGVIAVTTGCMDCDRSYLNHVWLDENLSEGLYVYLEIADSGCGMSKETMAKIFDPFFTTKFTGRGLGMAAVLGIVRGHRGAIKVYSEEGKGSTFKVLLPAADRPAELFNHPGGGEDWRGSGTALLVDDEETVRAIGREMLKELGFSVLTAADGREGLEIFKQHPEIAVVILDLTMPHLDGEQTFRELRKLKPDIDVIMSSGYNEQEVTQKFAGKGLAGFVQKPYKLSELRRALQPLWDRRPAAANDTGGR
ncbi:MAG: transporter substrate-binding domain-containing protein [Thermodesulfobacteriota bacterium]